MTTKVLIVDDEPYNVTLIEEILEYDCNFQYMSTTNGTDALYLMNSYNPDIVILDIMMPGINGYEVCRKIKSDKKHKFAKILMVSGKAMVEERLEGYDAGADDYITKPFVDDELLAKLKVFSKLKKTEELDELKTAILHLFSHETKTPLNGILLGSQLILDTPAVPEKITGYAKLIKISGERIHDLVRKILLLSSLRTNVILDKSSQSVRKYLKHVIDVTKAKQQASSDIALQCPEDFTLTLDWKLFNEAFCAVLENGLRFSPDGQPLLLTAAIDASWATFSITDLGIGIDPESIDRIFDEFHSHHIDNHTRGTALSLAISQEIMKLHHGKISVQSTPGQGTTFTLTLPAKPADTSNS